MNSESEHMEYKLRMKRAEIYNSIKIELEKNKYYMPTIVRRINSLRRNELSKPLDGILNDICFLLETLYYLSYSCECEKITGNNFFSYTTFYKISILHMRNILFDINKFIKQNKLQDKVLIKNYLDKIMKFSEEIISYRNDLEHNIDPFFDGKMDELQQSITVSNIILYLKLTQLSLDRRDILIMQEIHYKRNKNINSQLIAKKLDRIVLELGLKQMELNKALFYTYKDNKIKIKDYTGLRLNPYLYFLKLAIIFYYQMIDKFSFYINQKYRLNIDKTYFKDIIKKISDNSSNINLIDDKFIDLYNSEEYYQLNVLRQSIIHKEKYINYEKNSKKISSLLISITSMANLIILNIINEYLKENGHVVTNEAIIESNQKSLYRKL